MVELVEKMAEESSINAVGSTRLHRIVETAGIIRLTVARGLLRASKGLL